MLLEAILHCKTTSTKITVGKDVKNYLKYLSIGIGTLINNLIFLSLMYST